MTLTPLFNTGYEHGFNGTAAQMALGGGLATAVAATPTVTAGAARTGSYGLHIPHAANAAWWVHHAFTANAKVVLRVAVKFSLLPTGADMAYFLQVTGLDNVGLNIRGDGVCLLDIGGGTQQSCAGVGDGSWHVIELQIDASATTWTCDWKVDGVAQTRATFAEGATGTLNTVELGTHATNSDAYTCDYDDLIVGAWTVAGTDWWGDGGSIAQQAASDGTHVTVGNFRPGDAGTAYSGTVTTAYTMVDDAPATGAWTTTRSTTDSIGMGTNASTAYMEIAPATTAQAGTANAVRALLSYSSSSTSANLAGTGVVNSGGTQTDIWGTRGGTGASYAAPSSGANGFKGAIVAKPVAGWTATEVNALRWRFGGCTSGDVSPVPTVQGLMLEVDWPIASATSLNAPSAAATGAGRAPTSSDAPSAPQAAATGAAPTPTSSANATVPTAAATGAAVAPTVTITNVQAYPLTANASAAAPAPTSSTDHTVPQAAATGAAVPPTASVSIDVLPAGATATSAAASTSVTSSPISYGLVGTAGTAQASASGADLTTLAWGAGEDRRDGNLLACFVDGQGSAALPAAPSGWLVAAQQAGTNCSTSIFYRYATGGDAAPVIAGVPGAILQGSLAEFSGSTPTPLDQAGGAAGTSSPIVATAGSADATIGELLLYAGAANYSSAATATMTPAPTNTNGRFTNLQQNAASSTTNHYQFGYAITTVKTTPDSDSWTITTTNLNGAALAIATFKLRINAAQATAAAPAPTVTYAVSIDVSAAQATAAAVAPSSTSADSSPPAAQATGAAPPSTASEAETEAVAHATGAAVPPTTSVSINAPPAAATAAAPAPSQRIDVNVPAAGVSASAPAPSAVVVAPVSSLHDAFSGPDLNTSKWQVWGGSPTIVTNRLAIDMSTYTSIATLDTYDLRESEIWVELDLDGHFGEARLEIDGATDSDYFGVATVTADSSLALGNKSGTVWTPYDPVGHRWLRMRETGGTTYYETSPDGSTWTTQGSNDTNPTTGQVSLYSTGDGPGTGPAYFDNLNIAPPTSVDVGAATATGSAPAPTTDTGAYVPSAAATASAPPPTISGIEDVAVPAANATASAPAPDSSSSVGAPSAAASAAAPPPTISTTGEPLSIDVGAAQATASATAPSPAVTSTASAAPATGRTSAPAQALSSSVSGARVSAAAVPPTVERVVSLDVPAASATGASYAAETSRSADLPPAEASASARASTSVVATVPAAPALVAAWPPSISVEHVNVAGPPIPAGSIAFAEPGVLTILAGTPGRQVVGGEGSITGPQVGVLITADN